MYHGIKNTKVYFCYSKENYGLIIIIPVLLLKSKFRIYSWETYSRSAGQEISSLYVTRICITVFKRIRDFSQPDAIESSHTSLKYMLLLFSDKALDVPTSLFPSCFPTKICYTFLIPASLLHGQYISLYLICSSQIDTFGEANKLWRCLLCSFPYSSILIFPGCFTSPWSLFNEPSCKMP
jgi:hypothetical protein